MIWWAKKTPQQGFTIVELLIVVVVIAILAAITIVSYNGIQSRTYDSVVQNDLKNLLTHVGSYHAENGRYPINTTEIGTKFKANKGAYAVDPVTAFNISICYFADGSNIGSIALSKTGKRFYFTGASGGVRELTTGSWPGTSSAACASILTGVSANYNGYSAVDLTTGPWRAWVGGN